MKKNISLFLLLFLVIFCQNKAFAASVDFSSLDKVEIKIVEIDGSTKEEIIKNDNTNQFEQLIKERVDYFYNKYNTKEIMSINDIPLKDTQFISYSGIIKTRDKKDAKDDPNQQNAQNNQNQSLDFSKSGYLMKIDNVTYTDINVLPYVKNGTTYIEIKPILEAMDYKVTIVVNGYYKVLTAQKKEEGKEFWIDIMGDSKNAYTLSEGLLFLENKSEIKDSSICISTKSAEKLLGVFISVDFNTKQVKITKK